MAPTPEDLTNYSSHVNSNGSGIKVPMYTLTDVAEHNKPADAWIAYKGKVYDVSEFVDSHPGGREILEEHLGQDVTNVFEDPKIHEHSDAALTLLKDYLIGKLAHVTTVAKELDPEFEDMFLTAGENENLIDLEKPIITQMWNTPMTLEQYLRYTHTPRFLKGGRVARFFENDFLEFCSRNSWHSVCMWIPVAAFFAYQASFSIDHLTLVALWALGVFIWTLLEYSIHRWIFHMDKYVPDVRVCICLHFILHGVHHFLPMDRLRLVFPWPMALITISFIFAVIQSILPLNITFALVSGGLSGYIMYDLTHYYLHHAVPQNIYMKSMKTYHLDHHYKNYEKGYGITSKFWDYVFGTVLPQ